MSQCESQRSSSKHLYKRGLERTECSILILNRSLNMSRDKLVDGNFFLKNREEQQWVSPAERKNSELNSNCPVV